MIFLIAATMVIGIGLVVYQYNNFTPQRINVSISEKALAYYKDTWESNHLAFEALAKSLSKTYNAQVGEVKVESDLDSELSIDYCHIPSKKASSRLLIISSGVHGIEGYVGSAVQRLFLNEVLPELNIDEMGILLIHGINAYGFKHNRRVSENNVDLNRNCSTKPALYNHRNKGYEALNKWLNPSEPVNPKSLRNVFFILNAVSKIATNGMSTLRQAVLQGQYQFENSIYFGGKTLDGPIKAITPLIQKTANSYDSVFCIDLHTGYGERGVLHLFPNPMEEGQRKDQIKSIFQDYPIDWGDGDDFYTVTGDFVTYVGAVIPEKHYLTMTFEFGTLDSQTTFGAITSLHRVILENQGFHHGFDSENSELSIKSQFVEGYYPSSKTWRTKAIEDAKILLKTSIPKYAKLLL